MSALKKSEEEEVISASEFLKKRSVLEGTANITASALQDLVSIHGCQLTQGVELWEETVNLTHIIPTGCDSIDKLLDGGLFTGELTEIFGPPSSGKTQIAFQVTANGIHSMGYNVLYIDTSCSFEIRRIQEIINSNMCSPLQMKEVLSRLRHITTFDIFEMISQIELLKEKLASSIDQFASQLKLIVIDSVHSIISPILGGKQTQGHAMMIKLSILLKELAYDYGIAVLVLNGTVTSFCSGEKNFDSSSSKLKPALGKYWYCVPNVRLLIDFASKENVKLRSLTIHKHTRLPLKKSKALFYVKNKGLKDS